MMMELGIRSIEEDVLCELREDRNEQGLAPGFKFHPTDQELITFYLAPKLLQQQQQLFLFSPTTANSIIKFAELDLNKCEPWDLPDAAKMGEREWYFFSLRDRKYPTGLRTNRATAAGYWKATGKDKEVYGNNNNNVLLLLGTKKTLVFYKGRAPRGEKTRWVMHEYRLDPQFSCCRNTCKEEWVICRIFHKIKEKKPPIYQGQHNSYFDVGASSSSPPKISSLPPPDPTQQQQQEEQANYLQKYSSSSYSINNGNNLLSFNALQLPPHHSPPLPTTSTILNINPNLNNRVANNHCKSSSNNTTISPSLSSSSVLLKKKSFPTSHQQDCYGALQEEEENQLVPPPTTTTTTNIPKQYCCKTEANYYYSKYPASDANMRCCCSSGDGDNSLGMMMDLSALGILPPAWPTTSGHTTEDTTAAASSLLKCGGGLGCSNPIPSTTSFDFNKTFASLAAAGESSSSSWSWLPSLGI